MDKYVSDNERLLFVLSPVFLTRFVRKKKVVNGSRERFLSSFCHHRLSNHDIFSAISQTNIIKKIH